APQSITSKRVLWEFVASLISRWDGHCLVLGDFNEVRCSGDRMGTVFNAHGAKDFNRFISNSGLVELQLEGFSFTWSHPSAKKMSFNWFISNSGLVELQLEGFSFTWSHPFAKNMSKLDRFFVTDGLLSLLLHLSAVCLDRNLSDHRPILLREVVTDYGSLPFRCSQDIRAKLHQIDIELEKGGSNEDILLARMDLLKMLNDFQSSEARDRIQKAKIQWAIEGDENSKFFHGVINRKRANLAVKGVIVDGVWMDDPCLVKEEFRLHFASRFSEPISNRCRLNYEFPTKLSPDQASDLERTVSNIEVRNAVWDCGDNKSPGPYGFTFEFFRKYWDVLGTDFCAAVDWFFEHYVQTAFLLNRQILDGPCIINELLSWCKQKKQKAMVFKVDFAKAINLSKSHLLGVGVPFETVNIAAENLGCSTM
nr:RNA-directed DNA polymerase, eukaryota [Tanacetum cinerariifolium]